MALAWLGKRLADERVMLSLILIPASSGVYFAAMERQSAEVFGAIGCRFRAADCYDYGVQCSTIHRGRRQMERRALGFTHQVIAVQL